MFSFLFFVVIVIILFEFSNIVLLCLGASDYYSFLICLLWAEMGAVDVAFTEAAVGAGVSTVIMIATVFSTTRRSKD